jgi:hypothetical protein
MSLQVAVAHTGQRLDADPVAFTSVDALKHYISRVTEIAPHNQILLTTQGKHVKLQALLTEVLRTLDIYSCLNLLISFCRRRYSYTVANCPITPRLPYLPPLSPRPSLLTTLPTRCPTTPTCEHGKPSSRPAATGLLLFSRNHSPCRA